MLKIFLYICIINSIKEKQLPYAVIYLVENKFLYFKGEVPAYCQVKILHQKTDRDEVCCI